MRLKTCPFCGFDDVEYCEVEVEHMKIAGGKGTGFISQTSADPRLPDGTTLVDEGRGVRVMRHTLRG